MPVSPALFLADHGFVVVLNNPVLKILGKASALLSAVRTINADTRPVNKNSVNSISLI